MGTTFKIEVIDSSDDTVLSDIQSRIHTRLGQIENIASTYRNTAEISQFNVNQSTDWIDASMEFCSMVAAALRVGRDTQGAFDITVSPLVNLWGFGPANDRSGLPQESDIDSLMSVVGYENVDTDCSRPAIRKSSPKIQIDLSGWAKGYAVDQLALLLDAEDLANYLVEIGGEIKVRGHNDENRQFSIAIEKPADPPGDQYSLIRVSDIGIATSGDYRNYFVHEDIRYSHTIDPRTGRPVEHNLRAVSVIHESTAYADAIATALMVLGPDDGTTLANQLGIAAYFAVSTTDGLEFRSSDAFAAKRYLSNQAKM
jgi:thiamine biosynthesis lipoprotein